MDRRQELIDAASQVFYKKGYADTTLQDIANLMNFTKPAIYYYASSKEALFLEFYEQVVNGAIESAKAVLEVERCSKAIFSNTPTERSHRLRRTHARKEPPVE